MEQVAEYRGKPTIDVFSKIIYDAGIEYGSCMIVLENNNIGFSVLEKLIEQKYPNIYYSKKNDSWRYQKIHYGKNISKCFKNKIDAICYKYIHILELRILRKKKLN